MTSRALRGLLALSALLLPLAGALAEEPTAIAAPAVPAPPVATRPSAAPESTPSTAAAPPTQPPQAPGQTYAFPAMVQLVDGTARVEHDARTGPANPSATIDVASPARHAYAITAARMFAPSTEGATALVLRLTIARAEVVRRGGAWIAAVAHDLAVVEPGGAEVARFRLEAGAPVVGLGAGAIPAAFGKASRQAAEAFEARFDASPEVGAWLSARGHVRRVKAAPPPRPPDRPRPDWVASGDLATGTTGGGMASSLRAGVGWRWGYAQVVGGYQSRRFQVNLPGDITGTSATFRAWTIGLEAGPLLRLEDWLELRLGAGLLWVSATAEKMVVLDGAPPTSYDLVIPKTKACATAGASVSWISPPFTSHELRARVGLDVKAVLGSELAFDAFGRTLDAGGLTAMLVLGVELPAGL
ncbi:MAG: hypothetical protein NDI82_02175 [Anaeromyxobacteraceae bacterium]|nr:hypothetical protein [Anaeromyxobacteraceae bacterium]